MGGSCGERKLVPLGVGSLLSPWSVCFVRLNRDIVCGSVSFNDDKSHWATCCCGLIQWHDSSSYYLMISLCAMAAKCLTCAHNGDGGLNKVENEISVTCSTAEVTLFTVQESGSVEVFLPSGPQLDEPRSPAPRVCIPRSGKGGSLVGRTNPGRAHSG